MTRALRDLAWAAVMVACAVAAYTLGDRYIQRLPNHAGYYLVAAGDRVEPPAPRPRRVFVIVADGLRSDAALTLRAVARLRARGQCRITDAGPLTVSRPVYTMLSTGLEQDRTGSRNNAQSSPVAVESIWEVAREAGWTVIAASGLSWWRQLFPDGFDDYVQTAMLGDVFAPVVARLDAVTLASGVTPGRDAARAPGQDFGLAVIHPLYVDEDGHDHGAASREYRDAVARLDRELAPLLGRIDLARDLVIFTSDHGHTDAGGHGGDQREVRFVLTCFAGRGVRPSSAATAAGDGASPGDDALALPTLDGRAIAPALAVLAGLRFPRHMRADPAGGPAGDDLDAIWEIADESALPASYVADRRAAIDRFRRANGEHLARWHEPGADWRAFYRRERNRDRLALAAIILGLVIALAIVRRRRVGWRGAALALAWMAAVIAVTCALHVAVRGSFDFTSINRRAAFIRVTGALCAACATLGFAAHWLIWRDPRRWLHDQLALALLGLAVGLAHIVAFGWPLGFPLPGAALLFLPFFAALFTLVHAGVAALGFAASAARAALRARI